MEGPRIPDVCNDQEYHEQSLARMGHLKVESVAGGRDYAHRYLSPSSTLNPIVDRFLSPLLDLHSPPTWKTHRLSSVQIELARIPIYYSIDLSFLLHLFFCMYLWLLAEHSTLQISLSLAISLPSTLICPSIQYGLVHKRPFLLFLPADHQH